MSDGLALSALEWWSEAGVDTLVDETPRDWLAAAVAPAATVAIVAEPAAAPPPVLPADLAGFRRYLLTDPVVPGPPAARLDASGDPASGTMVLLDMPEPGDRTNGALLGGEVGALFDRMLDAMGLSRDALYLAPFAPAAPASGKLDDDACRTLTILAHHHLALVAPKRLLLMGDAPVRALTGQPLTRARAETHAVDGIPAVATFHPRLVHARPAFRKDAWADLQRFMELGR